MAIPMRSLDQVDMEGRPGLQLFGPWDPGGIFGPGGPGGQARVFGPGDLGGIFGPGGPGGQARVAFTFYGAHKG